MNFRSDFGFQNPDLQTIVQKLTASVLLVILNSTCAEQPLTKFPWCNKNEWLGSWKPSKQLERSRNGWGTSRIRCKIRSRPKFMRGTLERTYCKQAVFYELTSCLNGKTSLKLWCLQRINCLHRKQFSRCYVQLCKLQTFTPSAKARTMLRSHVLSGSFPKSECLQSRYLS